MTYFAAGATVVGAVGGAAISANAASSAAGAQIGASQQAQALQQTNLNSEIAALRPYSSVGMLANKQLATELGLGGTPGGEHGDVSNDPAWLAYVAAGGFTGAPGQTDTPSQQAARQAIYNQSDLSVDSNDPQYGSLTAPITQGLINQDPVYANGLAFGLNQGTKGIQNAALANGGYDSGATLKALTRFANDYGTTKTQAGVSDIQSNRNQQYGFLSGQQAVGVNAASLQNLATGNYANNASNLVTGAGNAAAAGIVGGANAYSGIGGSIGNAVNNYNNGQLLSSLTGGTGFNNYGGAGMNPYATGMSDMQSQLYPTG